MSRQQLYTEFPPEVIVKLGSYVYRLIDPRNGETFYVGKGVGNRVFAHVRAEGGLPEGELDNQFRRIHQIHKAGLEVGHVIHRHGLDEETACEIESALIDAYPGLTNEVNGIGGNDYGVMHVDQIIRKYSAEPAKFQHKALLISINQSASERSTLEATQYAWKIAPSKAKEAEVVLATVRGIIIDAFIATDWLPATANNFPNREDFPGRFGFRGHHAPDDIKKLYINKRVPDEFRKKGAANPIKYTW